MSVYAYSFWRAGQRRETSSFGGQYGASQSAVIGTYRLGGRLQPVSLLWRLSYVPTAPSQSELAVGARLQPFRSIPVTLSLERRAQADGQGRFSGYIAGGKDGVRLPARFNLAGYGQLGLLSRGSASGRSSIFYDAHVKIDHNVFKNSALNAAVGAGAWAGGQQDTHRLDLGPTLRTTIDTGSVRLRIDADWRFRIKGLARPNSGPALTLSTSF